MQDVFEIIGTTRSMRRLKPDPVPDEMIKKILLAGTAAANGGNNQTWRFLVVKDPAIKKAVQVWYKKAFDEVVGPRYATSPPPPGVTVQRYQRQHGAVEYLTEHFHEAPVWIVACLVDGANPGRAAGASIYPAVQNMLLDDPSVGAGVDADDAAPAAREGKRGSTGAAGGGSFLRDFADRVSDGEVRTGWTREAFGLCVSGQVGAA